MISQFAAIAATILLSGVACFQIALILGAPLGQYAWGGTYTVLPKKLRISSVVSTVIYIFCALIILESSGLLTVFNNATFARFGIWFLTAFFGFGIFLNAISKSKKERMVMIPIVATLTVLCLLIALKL